MKIDRMIRKCRGVRREQAVHLAGSHPTEVDQRDPRLRVSLQPESRMAVTHRAERARRATAVAALSLDQWKERAEAFMPKTTPSEHELLCEVVMAVVESGHASDLNDLPHVLAHFGACLPEPRTEGSRRSPSVALYARGSMRRRRHRWRWISSFTPRIQRWSRGDGSL
jgi:hypothetical protein